MFKLTNIMSDRTVEYEYNGKKVKFPTYKLITGRNMSMINHEKIFEILNSYLKHKGDKFREDLFKVLEESKDMIILNSQKPTLEPLPVKAIHSVLGMFDYNDVLEFVRKSPLVTVPPVLKEVFDETIIINDEGSREQTYTIDDYYQLIALITILKATLGPIGFYTTIRYSLLPKKHLEYILLYFYMDHPIFHTPPFQKLLAYVEKLVQVSELNTSEYQIQLIEKSISSEELPYMILGQLLFNRIIIADEFMTDVSNIITKIYNFIRTKLVLRNQESNSKIKFKNLSASKTDEAETESVIESYRSPTDITIGIMEEFKFATSNLDRLIDWMGIKNRDLVYEIHQYLIGLRNLNIPVETIKMVSWYTINIIDPRAIDYLDIDNIINLFTVATAWLIEHGYKDVASLFTAYINQEEDELYFRAVVKKKITPEVKEKLDKIFPYKKKLYHAGQVTYVNLVEETIIEFTNKLHGYNLMSILPRALRKEYLDMEDDFIVISDNIRNSIALSLCEINES